MEDKKMIRLNPRDFFECMYIHKYIENMPYSEAKEKIESNRFGDTYSDAVIASFYEMQLMGVRW